MAQQFGLATMEGPPARACPFTSGTTSGIAGSMRNAVLLSTTSAPAAAARGPWIRASSAPVEKSATSSPRKSAFSSSSTSHSEPFQRTRVPAERRLAKSRSRSIGKPRCSRTRSISWPTAPVAPTTATLRPMRGM